jgi:glutamate synthase domain-containing protein 2
MPLRDGLHFVHQALRGIGVRDRVCLIGAGKVFSAFHLLRLIALGADAANSARGMMFALGCIQSRNCNNGRCPSGVATQNPARYKGLDVTDKGVRVANYHRAMMRYLAELMGVAGIGTPGELQPAHIHRRVSQTATATYAQLYPAVSEGCLLAESAVPEHWREAWGRAREAAW